MKYIIYTILLSILLIAPGCSTDVDINAKWDDVTVVYGVLDQRDSRHYIKINKAFLGEMDAYEMAKIRDSSEYAMLDASVIEFNEDIPVDTFPLIALEITDKDDGIFYSPSQTVYYFETPLVAVLNTSDSIFLHDQNSYKVLINLSNGDQVFAETEIIDDFNFSGGLFFQQPEISFASANNYSNIDATWSGAEDGKRYQFTITFKYVEYISMESYTVNGTTYSDTVVPFPKSFDWIFPAVKSVKTSGGEPLKVSVSGEEFYQQIAAHVPPWVETPTVERRVFDAIDLTVTIANDELNTYLEVNEPSTGIIQEKPVYTNIENGIGIFASRYKKMIKNKKINHNSMIELWLGQYTADRHFCSLDPSDPVNCPL